MKLTRTFNIVLRLPWMVCVALTAGAAWAAPSGNSDPKVPVYFHQHCLKCQDADAEKGDLRIDHLSPKVGFGTRLRSGAANLAAPVRVRISVENHSLTNTDSSQWVIAESPHVTSAAIAASWVCMAKS